MSYARWGWAHIDPENPPESAKFIIEDMAIVSRADGGSSVYVYGAETKKSVHGKYIRVKCIDCCGCSLNVEEDEGVTEHLYDYDQVEAHFKVHRDLGHNVPEGMEEEIRADGWLDEPEEG